MTKSNATIISMWTTIFLLVIVVSYVIIQQYRVQPVDVLGGVNRNTELIKQLSDRMNSRFYFGEQSPNIWELIDANDLTVPEGWER